MFFVRVSEGLGEDISVALVLSYVMVQSPDYRPIVSFYLTIQLRLVCRRSEMLHPKEAAYSFNKRTPELCAIVCH